MKLLISGSRKATHPLDYARLKEAIQKYAPQATEIWHGGAHGIDALASLYAREHDLVEQVIRPDYQSHYHKAAPLLRNTELVKACDACIVYYVDSHSGGTKDTETKASRSNKLLAIISRQGEQPVGQQMRLL
ncbi:MAG: SLOG family protein [Bacteroidota bacterium]